MLLSYLQESSAHYEEASRTMIAYIGYMMLAGNTKTYKNTPANLLQHFFPNLILHLHSLHSGNIWIHTNYHIYISTCIAMQNHSHYVSLWKYTNKQYPSTLLSHHAISSILSPSFGRSHLPKTRWHVPHVAAHVHRNDYAIHDALEWISQVGQGGEALSNIVISSCANSPNASHLSRQAPWTRTLGIVT